MKNKSLMKRCTLLFVLLWTSLYASAFSYDKQEVRLFMQNAYLKDVLWEIERQTPFVFMYNREDLDAIGKLNINIDNVNDIRIVMERCLHGTSLTYEIANEVIVIKPSTERKELKRIIIEGKVTDAKGASLPGVTIFIKNAQMGTSTDENGYYKLELPAIENISLLFSFIGMQSQEIKYTGKSPVNVIMHEDKQELNEVIVTGYANIRKESFTGNATTVSKEELLRTNNKNLIAALQSFDPSFRIRENSQWGSDPNALPEINIRGQSSIGMEKGLDIEQQRRTQRTNLQNNPNMPVFILDGFEVDVQKIYDMDVNRIESMTILKDAAATAMYGSRAANGVVVVTTVAPKAGEMQIHYNFTGGMELPDLSDYNLCNAAEKLEVERLSGVYTKNNSNAQVNKDKEYNMKLQNILRGVDTDWLSKPLRNVFNHKHSLNLSGGVESIRYSLDLNYDSNNGVMKDSYRNRMGAGLTLDYRSGKWLQLMNVISYNQTNSQDSPYGDYSAYSRLQPYLAIYDDQGNLLRRLENGMSTIENPLWKVANLQSYNAKSKSDDLTNNFSLNLFFLDGFQFKGQFSITKRSSKNESFIDPKDPQFDSYQLDDMDKGQLSRSTTDGYSWNMNTMLYYNKNIHKNFINATLGVNMNQSYSESSSMLFKGFQLGAMSQPAFAAQQPNKTRIQSDESRLVGLLGSLNYSYDNIYLFDGSFRLDGSSQFGKDKRFAPFWSLGAGINFHNYKFLQNNWLINTLKVRASYGNTGKVNFPSYAAVTTYNMDSNYWYLTGPATSLKGLGNSRLTWESTHTWDAGITLSLLQDRFYINASYYHKETKDLIDEIAIQTSSGFDQYKINSGSVLNEGFEINVNATLFRNNNWLVTLNGNLGSNKNTITKLGAEMNAYNQEVIKNFNNKNISQYTQLLTTPLIQYYEGASTTAIYAVRSEGIDPANGKERLIKKNGLSTYEWDANDQIVVGDESPDAQGSFGINVGFKGLFINASFMYQWGGQTYNETLLNKVERANIEVENVDKRVLTERWKNIGDIAPFYDLKSNHVSRPTTRFVQDYNYISFNSLSVGYDFNRNLISKWHLTSLGIRFNANDLGRWSSVKQERGLSYPYAKNFNFTVNIGI